MKFKTLEKYRPEAEVYSTEISKQLLKYLQENNYKQKHLAEKLGVNTRYITKLLKGKENYTLTRIVQFEKELGLNIIQRPKHDLKEIYNKSTLGGCRSMDFETFKKAVKELK